MSPITLYTSKKAKKTRKPKNQHQPVTVPYHHLNFLLFERAPFNVDTDFNQTCIY